MSELVGGIEDWIGEARIRLAHQERRFFRWLKIGTVVASIAGLLFAGLNVLLFQQGRRWSNRDQERAGRAGRAGAANYSSPASGASGRWTSRYRQRRKRARPISPARSTRCPTRSVIRSQAPI